MVERIEKLVFKTDFRDEYCGADSFWVRGSKSNQDQRQSKFDDLDYQARSNEDHPLL